MRFLSYTAPDPFLEGDFYSRSFQEVCCLITEERRKIMATFGTHDECFGTHDNGHLDE